MKSIEPYQGIANIYDEIRPSYPMELIEDIVSLTGINHRSQLLEVGAGTGKATLIFAEKKFKVIAIEPCEDMAKVLQSKSIHSDYIYVDVTSFEEWENTNSAMFDMIFSAQAFHWVDPNVKFTKSYQLLKSDGYLILFWYIPTEDTSPTGLNLRSQLDQIIGKYRRSVHQQENPFMRKEHDGKFSDNERMIELSNCDLFELVDRKEYAIDIKNSPEEYVKVLKSVPNFASIMDSLDSASTVHLEKELIQTIKDYGGNVHSKINYFLYVLKKRL